MQNVLMTQMTTTATTTKNVWGEVKGRHLKILTYYV